MRTITAIILVALFVILAQVHAQLGITCPVYNGEQLGNGAQLHFTFGSQCLTSVYSSDFNLNALSFGSTAVLGTLNNVGTYGSYGYQGSLMINNQAYSMSDNSGSFSCQYDTRSSSSVNANFFITPVTGGFALGSTYGYTNGSQLTVNNAYGLTLFSHVRYGIVFTVYVCNFGATSSVVTAAVTTTPAPTPVPTTAAPTTRAPTTAAPTTPAPTTPAPTTPAPTTRAPTTAAPTTTLAPTTTVALTTAAPTTPASTCPNLKVINLGFGQYGSIDVPTATITYSQTNELFYVDVVADYLGEGYTWVVDFESWNPNTRHIQQPNNCENRLASNMQGSFNNIWTSAANAAVSGALNGNYKPYSASNWTLTSPSCDKVEYNNIFSFTSFLGCRGNLGNQLIAVNYSTSQMTVTYSGILKVTAVKALDVNSEAAGYSAQEFSYPFFFEFYTYVDRITSIAQDFSFDVQVIGLSLDSNGNLNMEIEADLGSRAGTKGDYIIGGTVTPPSQLVNNGVSMTELSNKATAPFIPGSSATGPSCAFTNSQGQCRQYFSVVSATPATNYGGTYAFVWKVVECVNGVCAVDSPVRTVIAYIPIQLSVQTTQGGALIRSFATTLTVLNKATYLPNPGSSTGVSSGFYTGETVVVSDQLVVQPVDANMFAITVQDAWLCFSTDTTFVPVLNATNNQFGCSAPYGTLTSTNIVHLISNQVPVVDSRFNTALIAGNGAVPTATSMPGNVQVFPYLSTVGFSFLAQPITTLKATYYIQVNTVIQPSTTTPTNARNALQTTTASQSAQSLTAIGTVSANTVVSTNAAVQSVVSSVSLVIVALAFIFMA